MVGGLKIVQVKPGHEAELERLFAGLRAEMRAHEPGCLLYSLLKSRAKPGAYIVHETVSRSGGAGLPSKIGARSQIFSADARDHRKD
jgi:Antibiotic biosynthesis monooxygenase